LKQSNFVTHCHTATLYVAMQYKNAYIVS
jgi:hypothetical protein